MYLAKVIVNSVRDSVRDFFCDGPSVRHSSYILYECVHVTESGRGNPKISAALRAPVTEPPFLNV